MIKDFDTVGLTAMHLECIVGIHPHERLTPQPLKIELELHFDRRPNAFGKTLSDSVDYSVVAGEVAFVFEVGKFQFPSQFRDDMEFVFDQTGIG